MIIYLEAKVDNDVIRLNITIGKVSSNFSIDLNMDILHGDKLLEELKRSSLNRAVQPLEWLIGKWHSVIGQGLIHLDEYEHCSLLTFNSYGEPALNFFGAYWDFDSKQPYKFENGFLRVEPGTSKMSFLVNHSNGLSSLEEGELINPYSFKIAGNKFTVPSILKNQEAPKYKHIERQFLLKNDILNYSIHIETEIPCYTYDFEYLLKKISD